MCCKEVVNSELVVKGFTMVKQYSRRENYLNSVSPFDVVTFFLLVWLFLLLMQSHYIWLVHSLYCWVWKLSTFSRFIWYFLSSAMSIIIFIFTYLYLYYVLSLLLLNRVCEIRQSVLMGLFVLILHILAFFPLISYRPPDFLLLTK